MKRMSMKILLATLLCLGAMGQSAMAGFSFSIDVDQPPPAPRYEVAPPPRVGRVWVPGFWYWEGHRHLWHKGRWERARPGQRWVEPRWEDRGGRHHFEPGRWEAYRHEERHDRRDDRRDDRHDDRRDDRHDGNPGRGNGHGRDGAPGHNKF